MKKQVKSLIFGLIFLLLLGGVFCFLKFSISGEELKKTAEVRVMSAQTGEALLQEDFKQLKSIVVNNKSGLFTIKLDSNGESDESCHLIKDDGIEVAQDLVEKSVIKSFIAEIEGMAPLKIISEEGSEFSKYGLEKGKVSIKLRFNGKEDVILSLGNEAPLSAGYYLRCSVPNFNNIYLISESSAEVFFFDVESFVAKSKEG